MAHTYEDQRLAREEWLDRDRQHKLVAVVVAEVYSRWGLVGDTTLAEYKEARAAEQAAWDRYQAIVHANEEVNALGTTGALKLGVEA